MISQEQADKIIAANNLRDAVKLLGATFNTQDIIDSRGKRSKRIIITYNIEKDE